MVDEASGGTPFVRITNREIYDALRGLEKSVASMDKSLNDSIEDTNEVKRRVRALELKVYTVLAGVMAAVTGWILTSGKVGG